ncbi:hypothetical protein PRIPAC_89807 [Pristionchus pacificus]|uniref:Uncharacterized protein n=1 Tax=Pristionchus pacificus TaxID=54126 RepID=A0A2A6CY66_PRIPA|nr:hypothetical protein PRIPAC_89807 [Pristionchus pacificus]|eukprot:PDM83050.1 hypothetical protein PRIPAC_37443 [Pristionchus pacificus]
MLRSLLLLTALAGTALCLTCSTSATVSNGVMNFNGNTTIPNVNGTASNTTTINLGTVSCPATLDRCMSFTPTNLSDVVVLNGVALQPNYTSPLAVFRTATVNGLVCASQADCVKMKSINSTSCLNSAVSCCCTGDLCTTKAAPSQYLMGSVVMMMAASLVYAS